MKFNKIRFAAGILSIALLVTGADMTVFAVDMDQILPVAGVDLSLNEGVSMKTVAEEKGLDTETEYYIVEPADVVKNEMVEEVKEDYSNLDKDQVMSLLDSASKGSNLLYMQLEQLSVFCDIM